MTCPARRQRRQAPQRGRWSPGASAGRTGRSTRAAPTAAPTPSPINRSCPARSGWRSRCSFH